MTHDVQIKLGAKPLRLRPTFDALREIEARLGMSGPTILQVHMRGDLGLAEMAALVAIGLTEAGEEHTGEETIAKRLFEAGIAEREVRDPVGAYLVELVFHPPGLSKKNAMAKLDQANRIFGLLFTLLQDPSASDQETSDASHRESSGQSPSFTSKQDASSTPPPADPAPGPFKSADPAD